MNVAARRNYLTEVMFPVAEAEAGKSIQRTIELGASIAVAEPWRILRAIYGLRCGRADWAPTGSATYLVKLLADCREAIRGNNSAWVGCGDMNRLIALRQAEMALERMIAGEATR